jgi:hypothetical protein
LKGGSSNYGKPRGQPCQYWYTILLSNSVFEVTHIKANKTKCLHVFATTERFLTVIESRLQAQIDAEPPTKHSTEKLKAILNPNNIPRTFHDTEIAVLQGLGDTDVILRVYCRN